MALMTLHGPFAFQVMACDADFVGSLFSPIIYLSQPRFMAVEAVLVHIRLVLPVIEGEDHDPHFEVNDFWPPVFRGIRICGRGDSDNRTSGDKQSNFSFQGRSPIDVKYKENLGRIHNRGVIRNPSDQCCLVEIRP